VYCRSGARSAKACEIMNELGFENAYNLLGGILAWNGEIVAPD
jgi:rhodanese-related sulfurtransferase